MRNETTRQDASGLRLDGRRPYGELGRWGAAWVVAAGLLVAVGFGASSGCGSPEYARLGPSGGDGASDFGASGGFGSGGVPQRSGGASGSGGLPASGGTGGEASGGSGSAGVASGGRSGTGAADGSADSGNAGTPDAGSGGAASGGRAATGGAGTGGANTGGRVATGGSSTGGAATGGAGTGGAGSGGATDSARYNFESSTQSWGMPSGTPMFTSVTRDTSRRFAGTASLAGAITATGAAIYQLQVTPSPALPAGAVVTAHIYVPTGSTVDWLQLFLQETVSPYTWTGSAVSFTAGTWNTLTVNVPTSGSPIGSLGVQVHLTGAWTGTVYIDSVNW